MAKARRVTGLAVNDSHEAHHAIVEGMLAQDTKAAQEVGALADFHAMLGQDSARAFYGPGHVRAAADLGAVQTLLLSDTLFRVNDVAKVTRRTTQRYHTVGTQQ